MSEYTIGAVTSSTDLERAVHLEEKVFSPFGTNNSAEIINFQHQVFSDGFIVAKHDDVVVGYSSSEKWKELRSPKMGEDPRTTHSPDGQVFCITTMVVEEEFRGKGIGRMMLEHLVGIAVAHECHTMIVETPRTRSYYEENGFQLLRVEEDRNLEVAILTKKLITM